MPTSPPLQLPTHTIYTQSLERTYQHIRTNSYTPSRTCTHIISEPSVHTTSASHRLKVPTQAKMVSEAHQMREADGQQWDKYEHRILKGHYRISEGKPPGPLKMGEPKGTMSAQLVRIHQLQQDLINDMHDTDRSMRPHSNLKEDTKYSKVRTTRPWILRPLRDRTTRNQRRAEGGSLGRSSTSGSRRVHQGMPRCDWKVS